MTVQELHDGNHSYNNYANTVYAYIVSCDIIYSHVFIVVQLVVLSCVYRVLHIMHMLEDNKFHVLHSSSDPWPHINFQ